MWNFGKTKDQIPNGGERGRLESNRQRFLNLDDMTMKSRKKNSSLISFFLGGGVGVRLRLQSYVTEMRETKKKEKERGFFNGNN